MPRWRKATWAIVVWTILMAVWVVAGAGAASDLPPAGSEAEQAGRAIGAGLGITLIIIIWFIGFIVLGLIWLMSRPKDNVVLYGPEGQQITVSEKEAQRRIKRGGWTYQPPSQPRVE
jgi:hypothetical protein